MLVQVNPYLRKVLPLFQSQTRSKSHITYDTFREQHLCHFYGRDSFIPRTVTNLRNQFKEAGIIPNMNKALLGADIDIINSKLISADHHSNESLKYSLQILHSIHINGYQDWRRFCLKIPYVYTKGSSMKIAGISEVGIFVRHPFYTCEDEVRELNKLLLSGKLPESVVSQEFRKLFRNIFASDI